MRYLKNIMSRSVTPQSLPIPGTTQAQNNAGGFAWSLDDWGRFDRFLILGCEGGTYYVSEHKLARENALVVARCIAEDGERAVRRIVEISEAGRAPKNDPAIFALAMCAADANVATKRAAFAALPKVCRIGTHLYQFASYVEGMRGWGRGLRTAVANWYNTMDADRLAYQAVKYQCREGWSHRDMLRLAHPAPVDEDHKVIYHWMTQGWDWVGDQPHPNPALQMLWAFERAKRANSENEVVRLINDYGLPREAVPTEWLTSPDVWEALLHTMPMTAMIRNLATMTRVGLVTPGSEAARTIAQRVVDSDALRKARVHPIALLAAHMVYAQGHGVRGSGTWAPVAAIIDALDQAFYASFGNVVTTNKRWMLALDVSGSMTWSAVSGVPGLTPRAASAALALVTASVEPEHQFVGFMDNIEPLSISPRQRLHDVIAHINALDFGATDCAQPMLYALKHKLKIDTFVVLTDNETWYGQIHPVQALRQYRDAMSINAKLIVVGMTATEFTIADPADNGMLDVVGFDTATPQLMSDFALT